MESATPNTMIEDDDLEEDQDVHHGEIIKTQIFNQMNLKVEMILDFIRRRKRRKYLRMTRVKMN